MMEQLLMGSEVLVVKLRDPPGEFIIEGDYWGNVHYGLEHPFALTVLEPNAPGGMRRTRYYWPGRVMGVEVRNRR